ncbi:MAG TPA: EamA family transporter [Spirochaetia bacterium]|nr:EamA family transporter [Spirochaetia bacterium]
MYPKTVYVAFGVVCGVFGTTFLAIRMGLMAGASPVFLAGVRFTVAGMVLLGALLAAGYTNGRTVAGLLGRASVISLFLTAGTFGFMFWAETRIDSGYMARLDSTGPIVAASFAAALLRARIRVFHLVGFAAGTLGVILLSGGIRSAPADWSGLAAALVSVVLYSLGMVLYPKLFAPRDDPVTVNALQMAVGGILLLLVSPLLESARLPLTGGVIFPLLYLVVAGSIVGHTANLVVVRRAGPVFASSWLYVAPPIATAAGAIVLGETVGLQDIAGTLLALVGVFFVTRPESRKPV